MRFPNAFVSLWKRVRTIRRVYTPLTVLLHSSALEDKTLPRSNRWMAPIRSKEEPTWRTRISRARGTSFHGYLTPTGIPIDAGQYGVTACHAIHPPPFDIFSFFLSAGKKKNTKPAARLPRCMYKSVFLFFVNIEKTYYVPQCVCTCWVLKKIYLYIQ